MAYVPEPKGLGSQQTGAEDAVSPLTLPHFPSWEARGRTQPSRSEQLGNPDLPPPLLEQHQGQLPSPKPGKSLILTMKRTPGCLKGEQGLGTRVLDAPIGEWKED